MFPTGSQFSRTERNRVTSTQVCFLLLGLLKAKLIILQTERFLSCTNLSFSTVVENQGKGKANSGREQQQHTKNILSISGLYRMQGDWK